MSAIAGLLAVANYDPTTSEELVSEYQETILVRNAKGIGAGATLFGLMSKLKPENTETTEFKWFERDPVTTTVYIQGAVSGTTNTTIAYADASTTGNVYALTPVGTILRNTRTGEHYRVTANTIPATISTGVTITRAFAGTAAAINDQDTLIIVTVGKDEGATPVNAAYENASTIGNYIQTFNSTIELSNAFKASKLRTDIDGPLRERRIQALERVSRHIEMAYFLGKKNRTTGTNGYVYYTGGIKDAVDNLSASPAQVLNGNGGSGVALSALQDWMSSFMNYGSDAKLFLCGPKSYAAISTFALSATNGFRIMNSETVFGMNIQVIQTPFGELDLAMHPLFKEIPGLNDWGFVVDLSLVVQKQMEPLFLESNIQTPGQDSYKEQFRAKLGLKLKFAEAFGYAYSFSKVIAG